MTSELEKYQGEYLSIESLKNGFLTNGNLMCLLVAIKNIEDIKEIKEKLEKSKLSINKTIEEINEKTNEIRIENSMNTYCRNIVDNLKKYINVYEIDNIPDKRFKIMEYMKEYIEKTQDLCYTLLKAHPSSSSCPFIEFVIHFVPCTSMKEYQV